MTPELKAFLLDLADVLQKHGGCIEQSDMDKNGNKCIELIGPLEDCIRPGSFIDATAIRETVALKTQEGIAA